MKRKRIVFGFLAIFGVFLGLISSSVTEDFSQAAALLNSFYLPLTGLLVSGVLVGAIPLFRFSISSTYKSSKDKDAIVDDFLGEDSLLAWETQMGFELVQEEEKLIEMENYPTMIHQLAGRKNKLVKIMERNSDKSINVKRKINNEDAAESTIRISNGEGSLNSIAYNIDYKGRISGLSIIGLRILGMPRFNDLMSDRGYKTEDLSLHIGF